MDKTLRDVFIKIVAIVAIVFFISLYADDYTRYSPREIIHPGVPQIMPYDSTQTRLAKMAKYADVVQQHCRELRARGLYKYTDNDPDAADNANLMVSDKHELLACKAAGIAGSNVHRVMYALENDLNDANIITQAIAQRQIGRVFLSSFGKKDKVSKLKQYTKFMVIRDPLERILSAFRAELPATLWSGPIKPLFKNYLSEYLSAAPPMVPAWREVWRLCNPCEVQYDYILPLSAFNLAVPALLSHVGAPNITMATRDRTGYKAKSSAEVARVTYDEDFPQRLKEDLQEKSKIDYFLFYGKRYFTDQS